MGIRDEVSRVLGVFGMKAEVAAKAMNITPGVFRKKKSEKVHTHKFNKKNLEDLIFYVKTEASKLESKEN